VLSVTSLSKRFGGFPAVSQVSFEVRRGEILGLIGPNGSGKSTTFNLIAGALKPTAGSIRFEGAEIGGLPAHLVCRKGLARTFQIPRPFRTMSLLDNVTLAAFYGAGGDIARSEARRRAAAALDQVGLPADAAGKYPSQLSGGMIKRAILARALALDPQLLFLDEPTAGLDPISAAASHQLLLYLHQHLHLTVVMITHDLDTIFRTCNRVGVIVDRRMVSDTLTGIMDNPHPWIQAYFHGVRARGYSTRAGES